MPHSRTSWSPPIRCPGSTGHSEATGLARTKRYAHAFAASGLLNREPWLARQFVVLVGACLSWEISQQTRNGHPLVWLKADKYFLFLVCQQLLLTITLPFFCTNLFEHLPRSQCKLRTKGAYGVLAKRQPARGARNREVQHVTQRERVWRTRQRRHGPDSKRGAGDGSLQGNRQHTPPAARPALGCSGAEGWWGALDTEPE